MSPSLRWCILLLMLLMGATGHACHWVFPYSPGEQRTELGLGTFDQTSTDDQSPAGSLPCYRMRLTLVTQDILEELSDFPVLVKLTSERFPFLPPQPAGTAQIRLLASDMVTPLAYEIEDWGANAAHLWVRVPRIAPASNPEHIWLLWGDLSVPASQIGAAVWDPGFVGVWHLTRGGQDSTSNENHGTTIEQVSWDSPGVSSGAADLTRDLSRLEVTEQNSSLALTSSGTLEAWVKLTSLSDYNIFLARGRYGNKENMAYILQAIDDHARVAVSDGKEYSLAVSQSTPAPSLGEWVYLAGRWNTDSLQIFLNGTLDGETTLPPLAAQVVAEHKVVLGCHRACSSDAKMVGFLDEVRISRTARSAAWIAAQHRSMSDQLITYGAPELIPCP